MADQSKVGRDWDDEELDAIVADHFDMLIAQRAGRPVVKSHHAHALMEKIGRTHRSVEFKHMNISAVLRELGLPMVRGYKPKLNIQQAIFGAIDRHLTANPGLLQLEPGVLTTPSPQQIVFEPVAIFEEAPPSPDFTPHPSRQRLERLVRKFDPTERDFKNRALGKAGEELIVDFERRRLADAARHDLARKVRWVAQEDGDGAGYDVLSFDLNGQERLIEVKTTRGARRTPFFLTNNERALAEERPQEFRIFRLYEFGEAPRLFKLKPPLQDAVVLGASELPRIVRLTQYLTQFLPQPELWRAIAALIASA